MDKPIRPIAPDQAERDRALDPRRSVLVQAPAGSGKTSLLAERFLTLLGEVEEPGQVVAITFTNAAAAEMRNRILDELRAPDPSPIAQKALERSRALAWNLLDLPAQLRISTIDSFCRDLALQQPLLSSLGGGLAIAEQPAELLRRAARLTMDQIGTLNHPEVAEAVDTLLDWRDNNWQELEQLLGKMLAQRDRWMQEFVLSNARDWEALRLRLELPFARAVRDSLARLYELLSRVPGACDEAMLLARFACTQPFGEQHRGLAELVEFPTSPFEYEVLEEAKQAMECFANLVLTKSGTFRQSINKNHGFPADRKKEKERLAELIGRLGAVDGLGEALKGLSDLPPLRYTEDEWKIVRACFTLLRHAAGQLQLVFAEAAMVDFTEVAQIAQNVLTAEDGFPSDAAQAVAEGIHHLLVDEFQDTSRRQHQLLASLIAAWPDREGRTLFAVGDPMQSIYFFRDADAELFPRVKELGLEIPNSEPLMLEYVSLAANFRTTPSLVRRLNSDFERVFAANDGSGVRFSAAYPARGDMPVDAASFKLHLRFALKSAVEPDDEEAVSEDPATEQLCDVVELIRSYQPAVDRARASGNKFRVAVLARGRKSLAPIADALHKSSIRFRAVDLEKLAARPEVLDAIALARALLNAHDRLAWLGVLRAPWCGLGLEDLHTLTSADDAGLLSRPIPELMRERLAHLTAPGQSGVSRVVQTLNSLSALRERQPTATLGTWIKEVWLQLGGADCYDAMARANLDLLWSSLDRLPAGTEDLIGPALDAALGSLTAQPDPLASDECGVQLMTIHKSKGLEFEVVIVPDLQAGSGVTSGKLLSWLERGLKPTDDEENVGAITEFLIAPLPLKGNDSGRSKTWVDREYKKRESQEARRILYVAATRAREKLHMFARPACKADANGELSLASPSTGLLSTAWPALETEIRAEFEAWKLNRKSAQAGGAEVASLAAAADLSLFLVPRAAPVTAKSARLRRLPDGYRPSGSAVDTELSRKGPGRRDRIRPGSLFSDPNDNGLYARHEGGLLTRVRGIAIHSFLEELARLRTMNDWESARARLNDYEPRIAAQIRAAGVGPAQASEVAATALRVALDASRNAAGAWILSPHPRSESEMRWSCVVGGVIHTVQTDRIFRAGLAPGSAGDEAWWIVDYKTHAGTAGEDAASALPELRAIFAPQLEAYAAVLRNLHGADAVIRAAIYYPSMLLLDWWEA